MICKCHISLCVVSHRLRERNVFFSYFIPVFLLDGHSLYLRRQFEKTKSSTTRNFGKLAIRIESVRVHNLSRPLKIWWRIGTEKNYGLVSVANGVEYMSSITAAAVERSEMMNFVQKPKVDRESMTLCSRGRRTN